MAHQNIQFIKILHAKISQGKIKHSCTMTGLYIQYLTKIPHYPVPRVLESLQHPKEQTEIFPPLNNNTQALLLLQKRHLRLLDETGLNYKVG